MTNKRIFYASRSYDIVIYGRNLNAPCHEEMINGHQLVEVMNHLNGKISNQRILHSSGSYDLMIYDCKGYLSCYKEMIDDHPLEQVLNYLANSSGSDKMETTPINNIQIQNLFRRRLNG